jgi:hypothetical protein
MQENPSPSSSSSARSSRYRMTRDEFFAELDADTRAALLNELDSAAVFFLKLERPVYLEGLGIVVPQIASGQRIHTIDDQSVVHDETYITAEFEKCYDLVAFQKEKYRHVIETRDLAQRILPRLACGGRSNTERDIQRWLRGLIELIKTEIVTEGICEALPSVGTFFALHNRQGRSASEWFAGADIFLQPALRHTLMSGPKTILTRPCLRDAWELLEAAYGKPVEIFRVDLRKELGELGYQVSDLGGGVTLPDIDVAGFECVAESAGSSHRVLLYCTNGLRSAALRQAGVRAAGNELVFQLSDRNGNANYVASCSRMAASRVLTLAWILLEGSKTRTVKLGAGISSDVSLFPGSGGEDAHAILITPFSAARSGQLCEDGMFFYANVLAITDDEAALARRISSEHLISVLEYRKLDQHTVPGRPSVTFRSAFGSLDETRQASELISV